MRGKVCQNKYIRFDCDCKNCHAVILDGRHIADKLLEDIKFIITISNGRAVAKLTEKSANYFNSKSFNAPEYLELVEHYIETTDVAICANCGGEVGIIKEG